MRILVDIGHPGHVHLFKHFIWEMEKKGHHILITARNKEITQDLLTKYGIPFTPLGEQKRGKVKLIMEWVNRDVKMLQIARQFRPDFLIGVGNPSIAHVARVLGATSVVFTDTEHAKFANRLTFPFADVICTPSCFLSDIGPKQIRFDGYHELAYLHPDRFTPNPRVLSEVGLSPEDPFIIMRFVSWQASHDIGQHGIQNKVQMVKALKSYGRVIITSEEQLPPELEPYRFSISPEKLHDMLYYATLYVGEGATTASECAILGTHAIYINTLNAGTLNEQEERYHLISNFSRRTCTDETVMEEAKKLLENQNLRADGRKKREAMLKEKCDVTSFMVWLIENYSPHFFEMGEDKRFQCSFLSPESGQ
ncbi:MAG: DUF354 domain-containing protein [Methanomassiliicoccus sp.]|nr:DUF354 domain-containing protein [Methanomassiliicoccus sp.]